MGLFLRQEILARLIECNVDSVFVNEINLHVYILKARTESDETHIKYLKKLFVSKKKYSFELLCGKCDLKNCVLTIL